MPDFQDYLDRFYTKLAQIYLKDDARQSGYQSTWWFRRVVNVIKTELKIHNIYSETIVDLGCGSGLFLKNVFASCYIGFIAKIPIGIIAGRSRRIILRF